MWLAKAVGTDCQCPACSDSPKNSYTPEFRLQAEARHLMLLSLSERRLYLDRLTPNRRKPLEAELMRQWLARKGGL